MTSWRKLAKLMSQISIFTYKNSRHRVPKRITLIEERHFCDMEHSWKPFEFLV